MQPNINDIRASHSVTPNDVWIQCFAQDESAAVSSACLLPNVTGNQGLPQTESIQESSAFLPQQQAEFIDGSSPNESVEQDYEKVVVERDNFERMATKYKNQLHSSRCLLMLGFSGVFHAIDASPLGAQNAVVTSDRPGMHPFICSLDAFLQTQTVELTFNQQAETAEQPSTPGTIKQTSVPTSNDAPMIQATAVASNPGTIKQTSVPTSNDAPMIQANAVGSTPGTIKQTSASTSNAAPMIQANAVASTDKFAGQIKDRQTSSLELVAAPVAASIALSTVESAPLKTLPDRPPQDETGNEEFRTEKEKNARKSTNSLQLDARWHFSRKE
ncbi:hypothetical protein IV203_009630 [Nitzschia inconspicua]|uniref:Uncharacterized protein n=1 Tax=Nitzschia inconspicua TaxID=303405 RepID=A0A9K3KUL5_9STRA|nr:hypothetical protein IV203_009630 [Nitzschia inconspicua]